MFFKRSKSKEELLLTSKDLVEKNAAQLELLLQLAEPQADLHQNLREIWIKIKFFSPTALKEAINLDKKINNKIGDLKIALHKARANQLYYYSEELYKELRALTLERMSIHV